MEKIKQSIESKAGKNFLVVFVVILVGLGSFGLGRLSTHQRNQSIEIEYLEQSADFDKNRASGEVLGAIEALEPAQKAQIAPKVVPTPKPTQKPKTTTMGAYFASSRGNKYYHLGCTGGKTLKLENKIYFNTEQEAVNAGYEKSSSCK